jgi:hypothetical protein
MICLFNRTNPGANRQIQNPAGLLVALSVFFVASCGSKATVIDLPASQSMSITGKGPGQDAAFNPFSDDNSVAVVKNLGPHPFSIRVQDKNGNYRETPIEPDEAIEVFLPKGYELYLDSNLASGAKVTFRKSNDGD